MRRITKPVLLPFWWQDLLLAIPRVVCGYLLTSSFGADKFGLPWSPADRNLGLFEIVFWFPEDVSNYGGIFAKFPVFFAWMAGFSEAVGGFLFMLGFQTRISALLILTTMMGAIFLQQIQQGMWNTLPALGFLWVSIYSLTIGSGRFGLDYLLFKKFDR
ncbi:MAG: DoxX family protein [Saprospiraceae bacterium]|jgi:putative oxidoreductase|uniref:DoxX family protein n=1 Tax=Candidatus Brachybacter algidus TaxID=2982024 RepID=UPI001B58F138|nr:DoxX family protein [Candidatus Brachybacter algidus]MBP6173634.1 DoxX family protein [Saprospiraceae bacterium]MBP6979810.1 DoxX family protein [Candidatus Curtissbacteria bacterium]MBP9704321.1 DoxX family protein [Chitinophagales bacterium]MBK6374947.1 DoxX family protein [Candidatus Brachybacter algidus]MBK6449433.1 DoxX family protein [Candidatus Brachybacter algidus]